MMILLTMLVIGWVLGFVGAGGAGFIISILTIAFGVPIQTAFGTSLSAMVFTTLAGAYSHFREGNIVVKVGAVVGLFGMAGAFTGTRISNLVPASDLKWLTALALVVSAVMLAVRLFVIQPSQSEPTKPIAYKGLKFWMIAALIGVITGILSGTFGIGSTPFIQIGLLTMLGLTLRQSVGTTMMVILPIAIAGGAGYYTTGHLDFRVLGEVVVGTMIGSFIGAKFTKSVRPMILKSAMVLVPVVGAALLLV